MNFVCPSYVKILAFLWAISIHTQMKVAFPIYSAIFHISLISVVCIKSPILVMTMMKRNSLARCHWRKEILSFTLPAPSEIWCSLMNWIVCRLSWPARYQNRLYISCSVLFFLVWVFWSSKIQIPSAIQCLKQFFK